MARARNRSRLLIRGLGFGALTLATLVPPRVASAAPAPVISTVAGGVPSGLAATQISLHPGGLAFGRSGDLYVTDRPDGTIATMAGCGNFRADCSAPPGSGGIAPGGGSQDGSRVIRFDMSSRQHVSSVVAGNGAAGFGGDGGPATAAQLAFPHGLAFGPGGVVYIADTGNARIRRVKADGTIDTVAGSGSLVDTFSVQGCTFSGDGGAAAEAQLCAPMGLAMAPNGVLYVADQNNSRLRAISGL